MIGMHYGANHNLRELINTHIFIICPNCSGSTLLQKILATSITTWNLPQEGQHTPGFTGPNEKKWHVDKLWSLPEWIDAFSNPNAYNWQKTRDAWYFQAYSKSANANIFVEKSPPFMLMTNELANYFKNTYFIFMLRNPYATIESICRRRKSHTHTMQYKNDKVLFKKAATQVINTFKLQQRNLDTHQERGIYISYEELCDTPDKILKKLASISPDLNDLDIGQAFLIKDKNSKIKNMNQQQINQLTPEQLNYINETLIKNSSVIERFNYQIINA